MYLYLYLIRNIERNIAELLSGSIGHALRGEIGKLSTMFIMMAALVLAPAGTLVVCYTLASDPSQAFSPIVAYAFWFGQSTSLALATSYTYVFIT